MDNFLLHAVAAELETLLAGNRIGKAWQIGSSAILIDLNRRDGRKLAISIDPAYLGIHLTTLGPGQSAGEPRTDTRFVSLLRKHLGGAVVSRVEKLGYDRLVRIGLVATNDDGAHVERDLVVQLAGRAADLLIVESDDVLACLRERDEQPLKFADPPPPSDRIDPFQCTAERLESLIAEAGGDTAAAASNNFIGFTRTYARELAARAEGGSPIEALRSLLADIFERQPEPAIYSEPALGELKKKPGLAEFCLTVSPIRLSHLESSPRTEFPTVNEAAAEYFSIATSRRIFSTARQKVHSHLSSGLKKTRTLIANLEKELSSFANAERYQQYGELLLANLHQAVKTEGGFSVTDFYDASQATIEIPSAGKGTPKEAAEHYFRLARKARHGVAAVSERLPAARRTLASLEELSASLSSAESLDEVMAVAGPAGVTLAPATTEPRKQARAGGRKEVKLTGVRRYRSADGFEMLVGRTDRDNDNLTFRIAGSRDIWMHVADYPGSHVIVRNPQRGEIPPTTIKQAAQLAAKFSQARGGARVAVNYCERKFVTKPKGFAPGQVRLSSFKTIMVEPAEAGERI